MNHTAATRLNAIFSVAFFLVMLSVSFWAKNPVAPVTFLVAAIFAVLSFEAVSAAIDTL